MRLTLSTIAAVAVLVGAWAVWPFFALYDLANAVQSRDPAAVTRRVNFSAVRQSLTEQIVVTYLQLSGRDARLGQIGRGLAVGAVTSIADPLAARLISAETLVELLNNGWPTSVLPDQAPSLQGLSPSTLGTAWQIFVRSEQGVRRFDLTVPATAVRARQFTLRFRLVSWTWKLTGIGLPDELRVRLARELIRQIEKK
jgi:hypothetical protein